VPPEGTRGKTTRWKTGFYFIAVGAEVPILLAFMDYADKRAGLGPVFLPTGDVDRDMAAIQAYYAPLHAKNPPRFKAE
jgi:1-acyl-sn-glycerol-3-phosphate acyltransferase